MRLRTAFIILSLCLALLPFAVGAQELRVVTWNLAWFNDHDQSDDDSNIGRDFAAPNAQEFTSRVEAVAEAIAELDPALVALQEIENGRVVQAVADELRERHDLDFQVAFVQGRDTHTGQDVALLVRDGATVRDARRFDFSEFLGESEFKDLSKHLKVDLTLGGEEVTVVVVHLITDLAKRLNQARTLRAWIQELAPASNLVVLGDFNTGLRFTETTPGSEMGIIRGFGTTTTDDDLFDCHQLVADRSTHVTGRELDRILVSPALHDANGLRVTGAFVRRDLAIRGAVDPGFSVAYFLPPAEQDLSDHFPLVATFATAGATPPPDAPEVTKAQLVEALGRIEQQLESLTQELERIRSGIEDLDG